MKARSLYFTSPRRLELRDEPLPDPDADQLVVENHVSAISAGTELLLYRGELTEGVALDETLPSLAAGFRYPCRYGYASAGRVVAAGSRVNANEWIGSPILGFEPHGSHFVAHRDAVHRIPNGVSFERASLVPTVETAVNLALDARPLVGERVLVVGQGVVGLLTTALLARFPLARLWAVDGLESRRQVALALGAERSLAPEELGREDFDLSLELSGTAAGLNLAIGATGFEGRIVIGSWYGTKKEPIDLGTHFHRGRLTLISSQVSHLGAPLLARWSKPRRVALAFEILEDLPIERLVSHRFPVERASEAYRMLDREPGRCLQVLLTYT